MTRFDWRTEDEDEALSASAPGLRRFSRRPARIALLIVMLVAVSAAAVSAWQIRRQTAQRTRQIEADLRASYGLWQGAVEGADPDLFDTLLVGAEPGWQEFQRRMLARGLTLNRPLLGLRLAGQEPVTAAVPEITLAADLQSAEVAFEVAYLAADLPVDGSVDALIQSDSGLTLAGDQAVIELEQRLAFNQQGQRWVMARPGEGFWGEPQTIEADYLTLTFYEPDADFAGRFANDLNQELAQLVAALCPESVSNSRLEAGWSAEGPQSNSNSAPGNNWRACGPMAALNLHLAIEPELWLDTIAVATFPLFSGRQQLLPSPTVVGRPVDEAGYQFFYRLFSANLIASFRARLAVPVPLPDQLIAVACFPESRSGQRLFLYDPALDSWQMVRTEYAFRQFTPLPDDSGLVIEQHVSASESTGLRLRLWTEQEDRLLYDDPDFSRLMTVPFGWSSPLAVPQLLLHGFSGVPQATRYHWLNLDDCGDGGCAGQDLPGYPVWSPDGQQMILMIDDELYLGPDQKLGLTVNEVQARWTSLGPGYSPFWVDNRRFGFARYVDWDGRLAVEVAVADVANPHHEAVLTPADLANAAGTRLPDQPLFVNYLAAHPRRPHTLFISGIVFFRYGLGQGDDRQFRLLSMELPSRVEQPAQSLKRLQSLDGVPAGYPSMLNASGAVPFSFSPDGRWIIFTQVSESVPDGWPLYLYDVESDRLVTYETGYPAHSFRYSYFDWSADGRWLVVVDDGFMRLIAPDHDYEQKIPHEQPACGYIAWIDRN